MQFVILVACIVLPLSLNAYVHEKSVIENMERKLDAIEQDLELIKQQETIEPISPTRQDDHESTPMPNLELNKWSDPVLFMNRDPAFHEEETTYQEKPSMEKVLLYTKDVDATTDEVVSMGGKVTIQLGKDLVIANIPHNEVRSHLKTASTHIPKTASPQTLSYVNAYWKNVQAASMEEQPKIYKWTDKTAPMAFYKESDSSISNQRSTMKGKLAAVILIVSGPGDLAMSGSEVDTIKAEVLEGLQFWTDQAPSSASLSFLLYTAYARITVTDSTSCSPTDFALCHDRFAIPAIKSFGATKLEDIEENAIQINSGVVGAFTVFISKYKQSHFAYAYFGGGPIYMQYSNDGWGTALLDRVYAHEMGHVFNSPDEYKNCNCITRYGKGSCTERNANCDTCTASQVDCIMDTNNYKLCQYTRKHIGWCE